MDSPDAVPDGPRAQHDVLRAIVERIASHPGVMKIYLAGSLASGQADAYSDVDLVVHVDPLWTTQVWMDREQLVAICVERVLDLGHQWGGPDLSYAVLYQNGVYLDLTFVAWI
ncbi:MAG: nucleotidyltransferase family protein [Clostridia bacterium]